MAFSVHRWNENIVSSRADLTLTLCEKVIKVKTKSFPWYRLIDWPGLEKTFGEPPFQSSLNHEGLKKVTQVQARPWWTSGSSVALSGQYEVKPSHQRMNRSCQQHISYTMQLKKVNPYQLCSSKPEDGSCLTLLHSFASGVRLTRSSSNNLNPPNGSFYQKKNARKYWWRRKLSGRNRLKTM